MTKAGKLQALADRIYGAGRSTVELHKGSYFISFDDPNKQAVELGAFGDAHEALTDMVGDDDQIETATEGW